MNMEVWLLKALTEKMIALPFECALQTIQYVMTLGADGFITFITANMLETTMMVFKRIALGACNLLGFTLAMDNACGSGLASKTI